MSRILSNCILSLAVYLSPLLYSSLNGQEVLNAPHLIDRTKEKFLARFELPVAWQVTQAKFLSPGPLMQTETFRETWILEFKNDGRVVLSTPREKIPVIRPIPETYDITKPPGSVILTHRDLAKLLGMHKFLEKSNDPNEKSNPKTAANLSPSNPKLDQFLSLNFSSLLSTNITENQPVGNDIVLSLNEDEHFNIRIELDNPKF